MPVDMNTAARVRNSMRSRLQDAKLAARVQLAKSGYLLTKVEGDATRFVVPTHAETTALPPGAVDELVPSNPRLQELQRAYASLDCAATAHTQWESDWLDDNLSMAWFRGDNAYVWQLRLHGPAADARTYLSMLDIESRDSLGLLDDLHEDGAFGAFTYSFGKRAPVSRDLLDSVNEINYLHDRMGLADLKNLRVLDIGAGYGRLAHRMSQALPNLSSYDCMDGVAVSTFLCEYYLRHRGLPDSVRAVPLHQHETEMAAEYDLAVNVHSFSECSREAIRWWLDRIAERRIEWLLIVPNLPPRLLSTEADGTREDFQSDVLAAGYELVDESWVHESDEIREILQREGKFFLFRRLLA